MSKVEHTTDEFERNLKEREIAIKEKELLFKQEDARRARWSNPLVLAIIGAVLAATGNIVVTLYSGIAQRELENDREKAAHQLEREKAEGLLILEVIKTADPKKAADNLDFLVKTALIGDKVRRDGITDYIKHRPEGSGVSLPAPANSPPALSVTTSPSIICISGEPNSIMMKGLVADALTQDPFHATTNWTNSANAEEGLSIFTDKRGTTVTIVHDLKFGIVDSLRTPGMQWTVGPDSSKSGIRLTSILTKEATEYVPAIYERYFQRFRKTGHAFYCDWRVLRGSKE